MLQLGGATTGLVTVLHRSMLSAHDAQSISPENFWGVWAFEPEVILPLALILTLYLAGLRGLSRRHPLPVRESTFRRTCFVFGWTSLVVALVSPLHAMGGQLVSAHMTQHELLIALAAPMLVLSRPTLPLLSGLGGLQRNAGRLMRIFRLHPFQRTMSRVDVSTVLHGGAIWIWHAPRLYQMTLTSEWAHAAQHATFFVTALFFWTAVLRRDRHGGYSPAAPAALFITMLHTSVLGALIAVAPTLWYDAYAGMAPRWGISALEDQQMAGLIMWIPGNVSYAIAALVVAREWLRERKTDPVHVTSGAPVETAK
jgi:putative membrane protein